VRAPDLDGRSAFTVRTHDAPQARNARPRFPVKDGFCIVFDKQNPKRKSSTAARVHRSAARPGGQDR
jgi:hypothetical protein